MDEVELSRLDIDDFELPIDGINDWRFQRVHTIWGLLGCGTGVRKAESGSYKRRRK